MLSMIVANAAAVVASAALVRRAGTGRPALDVVLFLLFRLILVSATVLLAGWAGLLRGPVLGAAGAAALAALVAAGAHRPLLRRPSIEADPVVLGVALLYLVRTLLLAWFLAPYSWDALSYHLPKVAEWVRAGAIGTELGPDPRAWFSGGLELVETWWAVFLHHDALIELGGVEFLALGFAGAHALARQTGCTPRAAFLAGMLYAATPGVLVQSTACLNDAAAAAAVVAAAALVQGRAHPLLWIAAAATGLGVKATFAFSLPGLAFLAWAERKAPMAPLPRPALAVGVAAVAILLGGYWYARNARHHGNPLYPLGTKALATEQGGELQRVGPRPSAFARNASALLGERIRDDAAPYHPLSAGLAGWGVAAFALGLPSLLVMLPRDPALGRLAAAFGISLAVSLACVVEDPWNMRFTWAFPAVLAVAFARLTDRVACLRHGGVAALLFTLLAATPGADDLRRPLPLARLARAPWRERELSVEQIGRRPPPRAACLAAMGSTSYLFYGPDFLNSVVFLRPASVDDLVDGLKRSGAEILYAGEFPATAAHDRLLRDAVRSGRLRRVQSFWYALP